LAAHRRIVGADCAAHPAYIAYDPVVTQTVRSSRGIIFSLLLETWSSEMEKASFDYFGKLDAMGGMVTASSAYIPERSRRSLYQYKARPEAKERSLW